MNLPNNVQLAIRLLNRHGFHAHVVGGCVRDFCLGLSPHDFDLTTDATPEEMKEVFSSYRTVDTGVKHGTLTVLIDKEPLEITTWRVDGEYLDHRHPTEVTFTKSLLEDLKRRDFTVNAMCYSPKEGLIDAFSGREDLNRRILRAVGDPERRFEEDALRILRALRFASVFDFTIEENTEKALFKKKDLLKDVSAERIYAEFKKLLLGKAVNRILQTYRDVFSVILPEIDPRKIPELPTENESFIASFVYIFTELENPVERFILACSALKTENEIKKQGVAVLSNWRPGEIFDERQILHLLYEIGRENTALLLSLRAIKTPSCELELFNKIINENRPYRLSDLAVSGDDLLALGIKGKAVGETLKTLLFATFEGDVRNEKKCLLDYLSVK